jgi:hypothetical protein
VYARSLAVGDACAHGARLVACVARSLGAGLVGLTARFFCGGLRAGWPAVSFDNSVMAGSYNFTVEEIEVRLVRIRFLLAFLLSFKRIPVGVQRSCRSRCSLPHCCVMQVFTVKFQK